MTLHPDPAEGVEDRLHLPPVTHLHLPGEEMERQRLDVGEPREGGADLLLLIGTIHGGYEDPRAGEVFGSSHRLEVLGRRAPRAKRGVERSQGAGAPPGFRATKIAFSS